MNDKKQRKKFTKEFKSDAVKLVTEQGYNASEVGRRLDVHQSNVSKWVRQHRRLLENPSKSSSTAPELEAEVKRLRKENKRLLMEREILKKAAAFFANESN